MEAIEVKELKQFSDLFGVILRDVYVNNNDELVFETEYGDKYKLYHEQDCCESVRIEDIAGELKDLIGSPITLADEASHSPDPDGYVREEGGYTPDSCTWTFYKLATVNGYVTIRWYGESNGYYSESVNWTKC